MLFLLHALQTTETFVDVGVNAGVYTVLALKVVGCIVLLLNQYQKLRISSVIKCKLIV